MSVPDARTHHSSVHSAFLGLAGGEKKMTQKDTKSAATVKQILGEFQRMKMQHHQ